MHLNEQLPIHKCQKKWPPSDPQVISCQAIESTPPQLPWERLRRMELAATVCPVPRASRTNHWNRNSRTKPQLQTFLDELVTNTKLIQLIEKLLRAPNFDSGWPLLKPTFPAPKVVHISSYNWGVDEHASLLASSLSPSGSDSVPSFSAPPQIKCWLQVVDFTGHWGKKLTTLVRGSSSWLMCVSNSNLIFGPKNLSIHPLLGPPPRQHSHLLLQQVASYLALVEARLERGCGVGPKFLKMQFFTVRTATH